MPETGSRETAVVMGASMAGLLSARVLSGHFARVVLVERDRLPDGREHRTGVPQGHHTHALLAAGRAVLLDLFPGISERLREAGAIFGDVSGDTEWYFEGGLLRQALSGIEAIAISRPVLEGIVREYVRALPNVEVCDQTQVQELRVDAADRVTGVRTASGEIGADLTVDATGRGSRTPKWLAAMGFAPPAEELVRVGIGYTTRRFRRVAGELGENVAAVVPPTAEGKRGGVILAQEGGRWIVTLFAHFGNYAPPELPEFIEYARTLPSTMIYDVIRGAEPLGDGVTTRFPASRRYRYERLARFPGGFLVLGDGICSFNPIYGQGMSSAALQAVALGETLAGGDAKLARRFFRRAAKVVDIPWSIAVGNDLRMPEVDGPRGAMTGFVNWYMARLHRAAHHDPMLGHAFLRVSNLLAPPASVLAPQMAFRVLMGNLRGGRTA